MKQLFTLCFTLWLCVPLSNAQKFTISGYVRDAGSGEPLISANVYESRSGAGAVTNTYGFFSLTLPSDSVNLSFSYIGYETSRQALYLDKDISLNIGLAGAVLGMRLPEVSRRASRG